MEPLQSNYIFLLSFFITLNSLSIVIRSDALGHVFTMIGKDWTHSGVAKLYTDITRNGYQILYLTSRAIGQVIVVKSSKIYLSSKIFELFILFYFRLIIREIT